MAEKGGDKAPAARPVFTDADKSRARPWFRKANDCRERRDYDYAIECYIKGLEFWPEAVEEGHMPLRSLAIQRSQVGGKKPGMMDGLKKSTSGKDPKQALLNAAALAAKDPQNGNYLDALLRNAGKGGFLETVRWVAPLAYESMKRDAKPDKGRFKTFRQVLLEAADLAETTSERALEVFFLEQAAQSLDYQTARTPTDEDLKIEQRNVSGRLTITRGKYSEADSFRDSLQDGNKQKLIHDADRSQQGENTFDSVLAAARLEYEQQPTVPARITAYVDVLLKPERKAEEDLAIEVLQKAYEASRNYSFKLRADDVRLRQLQRQIRALVEKARASGAAEDQQQVRLAALEQREIVLEIFRERAEKYPTDLRVKFKLGAALFESGAYDEAIPMLQAAQHDPRNKRRALVLMGRAFLDKGNGAQATAVLREALDSSDLTDDLTKDTLYWLGRASQVQGDREAAKAAFGRLLRLDYNYAAGDARARLDELNKS